MGAPLDIGIEPFQRTGAVDLRPERLLEMVLAPPT